MDERLVITSIHFSYEPDDIRTRVEVELVGPTRKQSLFVPFAEARRLVPFIGREVIVRYETNRARIILP